MHLLKNIRFLAKEKTPNLDELQQYGAFGSAENDKKFEALDITSVQTAIRGRSSAVRFEIEQNKDTHYVVKCPMQSSKTNRAGNVTMPVLI